MNVSMALFLPNPKFSPHFFGKKLIYIEKSKTGRNFVIGFLLLATLVFVLHLRSMRTGEATGESALWFSVFTLPWGGMLSASFLNSDFWQRFAYPLSWGMIVFNACLLYLISGGLRIRRNKA